MSETNLNTKPDRGGPPPDKYLTYEQCEKLLLYVREKAEGGARRWAINRMAIEILLVGGVRVSEVCRLRIQDTPVKQARDVLYVRPSKHKVSRTVNISPVLSEMIRVFVKQYRKGAKPGSALLPSEAGSRRLKVKDKVQRTKQLSYKSIWSKLRIIGREAGVGRLTPDMMRYAAGTEAARAKKRLRFIQDQLGLSNPSAAQIYAETAENERVEQAQMMEDQSGLYAEQPKGAGNNETQKSNQQGRS